MIFCPEWSPSSLADVPFSGEGIKDRNTIVGLIPICIASRSRHLLLCNLIIAYISYYNPFIWSGVSPTLNHPSPECVLRVHTLITTRWVRERCYLDRIMFYICYNASRCECFGMHQARLVVLGGDYFYAALLIWNQQGSLQTRHVVHIPHPSSIFTSFHLG